MRLKLGRPDIGSHEARFAVPAATPTSPLTVTFLGVSTLLVSDGDSAVLTDGFFSRPSLATVGLRQVSSGDQVALGAFDVTFVESDHCPPDRYPGEITAPLTPPAKADAYRCGEAWSLLLGHRPSGRTALVQGSAGFVPGALEGSSAEVAYLGVGQLGLQDERYLRGYWHHTVTAVGARRVVLIHWDDFFRPLDRPLRALPYAGDDLDVTMRVLGDLAGNAGVELWLPRVWQPEDPWR